MENNAILVRAEELYQLSTNPIFNGQTRVDENGDYKMYWLINGVTYVTFNNILN